jgi:hypothetical protein
VLTVVPDPVLLGFDPAGIRQGGTDGIRQGDTDRIHHRGTEDTEDIK